MHSAVVQFWRCQCLFAREALADARMQGVLMDTHAPRPFRYVQGFPKGCQIHVAAHVPHLVPARSPSAVVRLVVSIIVQAFQGVAGWRLAHVCQEVLKATPPLTNLDAASSIVRPYPRTRIAASLMHRLPNEVGWRSGTAVGSCPSALRFVKQAPARSNAPVIQISGLLYAITRAVAFAMPRNRFGVPMQAKHGQSAHPHSSQVFNVGAQRHVLHGGALP